MLLSLVADAKYLEFLRDPDQVSRREELAAFFGPNAHVYLATYDRLRDLALQPPGFKSFRFFRFGLSGPAFFLGPVWFFYRKLWVYGTILTAALLCLAFLPLGRLSLPISLAMAMAAKQVYVQHSVKSLQALRGTDEKTDLARAAMAGGVSRTAGWIGGIVYALLCIIGIAGVAYMIETGQQIAP